MTLITKVLVATPLSVNEVGFALRELVALAAGPVTKTTFAVLLSPAKLAVTVTVSAAVAFKVTEHRPEALVVHVVALKVVPVPLLLNVTAWPLTGLLVTSATLICTVLVAAPSSVKVLGLAARKLVALFAAPGTKATEAVSVWPANAAVTVTVPDMVLFRVTEHVPAAMVVHVVLLKT